jgi:hypothetical protein
MIWERKMTMKTQNNGLQLVLRTAMLLALMLAFQQLRLLIGNTLISTIIIGSLVNLVLVVAAGTVGWRGTIVLSILSPVVALMEGHLALPILIPFVAVGNITIAVVFELIERSSNKTSQMWTAAAVASVAKTAVLYALIVLLFAGAILPGMGLPAQKVSVLSSALSLSFSWPQLVTAIIGSAIAIPVIKRLRTVFAQSQSAQSNA